MATKGLPMTLPRLTLERSLTPGADAALAGAMPPAFGSVYPDLPVATTWRGLFSTLFRSPSRAGPRVAPTPSSSPPPDSATTAPVFCVRTAAVQLRSRAVLPAHLCAKAGAGPSPSSSAAASPDARPSDALLLVSGSHPVRSLPLTHRWLPSSLDLLHAAQQLKQEGTLPQELHLWVAENPLRARDASSLQAKADAGATAALTQPPLLLPAYEAWYNAVARKGLERRVEVRVGVPFLTSPASLDFWLRLCGAREAPGAEERLRGFQAAAERGDQALAEFCHQEALALLEWVRALPGVAGLHLMPVTGKGRRLAARLFQEGAFDAFALPQMGAADTQADAASDASRERLRAEEAA